MNYYTDSNKNFIHFDSPSQLLKFKRTYNNLYYGHMCCEGKGILVINKTNKEISNLKKEYFNNINQNKTNTYVNLLVIGSCSICLDDNKPVQKTQCAHTFCTNCISTWLNINRTCPMCREKINC